MTYTTNIRLDDNLAAAIKAHAAAYGVTIADAIRIALYDTFIKEGTS